jgi:hypothetical protein
LTSPSDCREQATNTGGGIDERKASMRKLTAAIALAALLALPGLAQAKYEAGGGGGRPGGATACANQVLDMELEADELSANERIMADAWKSHFHARKAAALEGTD